MTEIVPSEILSRFILYKDYYRSSDLSVKYAAFLPHRGETSVFRISGITDQEVWEIGEREVAEKRKKPILGRADIGASNVIAKNLKVLPKEPPQRHANIVGWPEEKSEQKLIAIELAAEALFHKK